MGKHRSGVLSRLRRRFKAGYGGKETLDYIDIILKDPCPYCGEGGCDSIDHITPISRAHELTTGFGKNHWTNLVGSHKMCNMRKGSKGVII